MSNNSIFTNNTAQYGPNIASYAVKITQENNPSSDITINDLGSGVKYNETLKLVVRDYDNQIMVLNDQNQIIITSVDSSKSQVGGFNSASLNQGKAEFDNFVVIAEPGSEGIMVLTSSKAIDSAKIMEVFGDVISNNTMKINFRF